MEAICDVLEQLLAERVINTYAIGGATAAGLHGEPIATRDIDVFVFLEPESGSLLISLEPVFERLATMGFREFEEEGLIIHEISVQFISASPGLESDAVRAAAVRQWEDHRLRLIGPEYLAAMALQTGRPKDRARILHLLSIPDFDHASFESILARYDLSDRWSDWSRALGL